MRPHYSITTQPTFEPISLDQLSNHVRVDSQDDIDYIEGLIAVAREFVDSVTGRVSGVTSFRIVAPTWSALSHKVGSIPLMRAPLIAVQSVKYYAPEAATQTTMSAGDYRVIITMEPGLLEIKETVPEIDERSDAVEINFTAGHTDASEIPAVHRHAIKLLAGHLYENRLPVAFTSCAEIPFTLQSLINNQKIGGWIA
jgi:uncharacterized phiE125 gp8 family phage protein